jgi:molybdopterin molybdotransferase
VRAAIDVPRADVSVMDGYAVRAADASGGAIPVAFEVQAGRRAPALPIRTAARIFTGAELPGGADAVVPQEQAEVEGSRDQGTARSRKEAIHVRLPACEAGSFVRRKGEVCRIGDELAAAGDMITPQLAGLLACAGPTRVTVIPRPRLAVLTTGSELVSTHEEPGPGQIRDSNAVLLTALARDAQLDTRIFERVPDEHDALMNAVLAALERADLIVSCGGVAVGDYDFVPRIVTALGGEVIFRKVAIKPGKPILVGRIGSKWFVGLPGNPLSALTGWHLFAKPVADRLAGNQEFGVEARWAELTEAARNPGDRLMLSCAVVDFDSTAPRARLLKWMGSHDVMALSKANALVEIPVGAELREGNRVRVHRI